MQERYGGAYDEGVVVNKDRLKIYPGYSNYRGRGELLLISLVESFYPMQGNGTQLLRFIQGQEFELIEGLPKGEGVADFLIKCGFVHTGLKNRDGFSVMVWSNPEFEED